MSLLPAIPEIDARHTPEAIATEIGVFEETLRKYRAGEISDEEFRPFRLKHGMYGQRQQGVQMIRVKIVAGILTPAQLLVLADIGEKYATGRGHLTTRENVQFHFVQMENVPTILHMLASVGLTTREACGNTVRNVTACPLSGICPTEAFDVTPHALGVSRFLLRHPEFHNLPRKFKLAFSGCEDDGNCALAAIHDIGLVAQVRGVNGTARRGFKVLVGGGLGSMPTEAGVLSEFLPEELLPTVEAVLRVFNEDGNRKNKYMARMKFVLRAKGIEELKRLVAEKRKVSQAPAVKYTIDSPIQGPLVHIAHESLAAGAAARKADPVYDEWSTYNLMQQRQEGYSTIWIKLSAGNVDVAQMRGLASLMERNKLSGLRIAIDQNFVLPWIPQAKVRQVYEELRELNLTTAGARTIADVTGCPGATTCNLGITRSLTLSEVLARDLAKENDPDVLKVKIKISGCPNSCGQHHIADIGFYGNARKIGDQQAPFYQLMLGGKVSSDGVKFGRQIMAVPAKPVPDIIREILATYKEERQKGESFSNWAERVPAETITTRLHAYSHIAKEDASADMFVDWGDTEVYSLKLGRGECA